VGEPTHCGSGGADALGACAGCEERDTGLPMPARRSIRIFSALALLLSAAWAGPGEAQRERSLADPVWTRRPAQAGTYQAVRELSGRVELSRFSSRGDPRNLQAVCEARREAETTALATTEGDVARAESEPPGTIDLTDYMSVRHAAAQMRAYNGDMAAASGHLRAALQRVSSARTDRPELSTALTYLNALLGISELRRGELENCVHDRNASRCIFPLSVPGQHEHTSGAEAALTAFLEALSHDQGDLELRWLANLTAMTLGRHPDAVPAAFRIDPSRFASSGAFPRFLDDAPALGLGLPGRAGGAALEDFNADGRLDLVVSSVDPCEPLHYFEQQPDGRFVDRMIQAGLGDELGGINLTQADYNNDGRPDIFIMRGGWELPVRNSLLMNNGDGTFRDVTLDAGLLDVPHRTHSAAWADYDNDGWLDLFVGHEETPSKLFRNQRDGKFVDVTRQAGISVSAFTKGVAWGDYDRDGYPDLYISNYGEPNVLYHNNGDGTFADVTAVMKVDRPIMSFTTWFFDYDNDGWEDLFVAGFVPSVAEAVKYYLGQHPSAETMRLYRNVEGKRFEDVTSGVGLDRVVLAMGANFGDVDNDGWLDFYLGTGAPSYAALVPNVLFRNVEGRSFADVTSASGTGHLQKGHAISFGDLDGDGDEDLFVNVGGFVPGDSYPRVLFRNPGNANSWITLQLRGTRSNRLGLGARVTATIHTVSGRTRTIPRIVTTGGSFGASPTALHIGLADATVIDRLEIYWPGSHATQVLTNVPIRHTLEIQEDKPGWTDRTQASRR
jgi:hypothetical protein